MSTPGPPQPFAYMIASLHESLSRLCPVSLYKYTHVSLGVMSLHLAGDRESTNAFFLSQHRTD